MFVLPDSVSLSEDWKRRLNEVKRKAMVADEGSTYFLQVSSHPVVSLFIVTGDKLNDTSNERSVHLHYSPQPECYPPVITDTSVLEAMGYEQYNKLNGTMMKKYPTLEEYKISLYSLFDDIDRTILENHGVRCYDDGCARNKAHTNVFYLHICDVLNIFINKKMHSGTTEVIVSTDMLMSIPTTMSNEFEDSYLRESNKEFLSSNVDFVYYCYAYLGNKSFVPIRTGIKDNSNTFVCSKFFMNNDHFVMHQYGKLQEINQNGCGITSKIAYRTI